VSYTTDDAPAAQSARRDRGVGVDGEMRGGQDPVPKMCWFRDLDGNKLCVFNMS